MRATANPIQKLQTIIRTTPTITMFPDASKTLAPLVLVLSVIGVLYGSILAAGQRDMKRFIAYVSIAHFGFISLGIFAFNEQAMVGSATVHGLPDRTVRVELPRTIDLYSVGGARITLDDVVSDLPSVPRLDSAGNLNFRFGGRVRITGEADGDYRGNLPITVEYQ